MIRVIWSGLEEEEEEEEEVCMYIAYRYAVYVCNRRNEVWWATGRTVDLYIF